MQLFPCQKLGKVGRE